MDLGTSAWPDADAVETDLALLPVGSTEQHGPHAPLATDTLIAEAVARAGVEAFGEEVVVAPSLPVGVSAEHRAFAGTVWLSPDAFRAAVRDVLASLVAHGWNRVVVVNGHGGNVPAIGEVAAEATRDADALVVAFTWFDAIDLGDVTLGHGGAAETAVLRATAPELVDEDRVAAAAEGAAERWGVWAGGVNVAYDTDEFADNGVVGDPRAGDAEFGRRLLGAAGEALAELLDAVAGRSLDSPEG